MLYCGCRLWWESQKLTIEDGGVKITMNNWVEDERRERLRYVGKSKGEKEKKKKFIYIFSRADKARQQK